MDVAASQAHVSGLPTAPPPEVRRTAPQHTRSLIMRVCRMYINARRPRVCALVIPSLVLSPGSFSLSLSLLLAPRPARARPKVPGCGYAQRPPRGSREGLPCLYPDHKGAHVPTESRTGIPKHSYKGPSPVVRYAR